MDIAPINRPFITRRQACFVWSDAVKNLVPWVPKEKAEACQASAFQFNQSEAPDRNGHNPESNDASYNSNT